MLSVFTRLIPLESEIIDTIQRESEISFPFLGIFGLNPPAYFTLFGHRIYFYGVLIALGFLAGILYCARHSRNFGIKADDFYDMMILLIPLSILFARLYFVLFRLEDFVGRPASVFAVWEGGIAIYGGIIGGILAIFLVCRHKKIPFLAMLDVTVFGVFIGQIIGRWGNFMNREAFGAQTEIFCRMGLTDPSGNTIFVHPTFLYESLWNLVGFVGLTTWLRKGLRRYDGQASLLYFLWYGLGRAWIEGLRTDSLYIGHTGIRVSQALSLVLVLVCGSILIWQARREHPAEKLFVNRAGDRANKPAEESAGAEAQPEKTEDDPANTEGIEEITSEAEVNGASAGPAEEGGIAEVSEGAEVND